MEYNDILTPEIDEAAARALYEFIALLKSRGCEHIQVIGFLHNKKGAKIRLEPIETFDSYDLKQWNTAGNAYSLQIINVVASLNSGYADLTVEYKPNLTSNIKWKNLIWPTLVLIALAKYLIPSQLFQEL